MKAYDEQQGWAEQDQMEPEWREPDVFEDGDQDWDEPEDVEEEGQDWPEQDVGEPDESPPASKRSKGLFSERKVERWEVCTVADAYKPLPPAQYAVDGIIQVPSVTVFYGAPGCFKSMLCADLAACIAGGKPWLTPLPGHDGSSLKTGPLSTFWIDVDNGKRATHDRIAAVSRAYGLSSDAALHYVSMPSPSLDMSDRGLVRGLVEKLKSVRAGCVVIDNLASVSGGTDENTSAMSTVMDNFRYLAEEANVAVILIHHQRKSNGKSARAGERLRGHSSIEAHLELALLVERKEGSDIVRVRATKVRDWDVKPFSARFTYTHRGDTKQLETARFVAASVERPDDEQAARAAILAVLATESPLPKTVLAEKAGVEMSDKPGKLTVGKRAMEGIIKAMVDEGLLKSEKGRNNAQLISAV